MLRKCASGWVRLWMVLCFSSSWPFDCIFSQSLTSHTYTHAAECPQRSRMNQTHCAHGKRNRKHLGSRALWMLMSQPSLCGSTGGTTAGWVWVGPTQLPTHTPSLDMLSFRDGGDFFFSCPTIRSEAENTSPWWILGWAMIRYNKSSRDIHTETGWIRL